MGKKRRASENSSPDSSGSNPPSARPEIASASSGSLRALGTGDDQQDEPGQTMMNQRAQHDDVLPNKKKTTSPRANGRNQEPDADNGKVSDKPEGVGGIERAGSVSGSSADQDTICRQNREMVSVSATTAGAVMKDAPDLGGKDDGRRPNLSAVGDDLMELSLSSRWRTFEHDETLPQRTLEANTTAMMMSLERHVAETEESGWTETPPTWQETAQRVVNRYNDESIAEKTDPNGYYDTISDMNLNPSHAAQPYIVAKYPAVEDIALDIDITASTRDSIKEEQESLNSHRNSSEKSGSGDDDAGDRSKIQDCDESVIDNDDDLSNDYPLYYDDPSVDVPSSAEIPKGNATTSSVREQLHEGAYFEQKGEDEDISAKNDVRRMTDASRPDGNGMNSDISDFHAVPAKQSVAAETDKNCNAVPKFEPDTDHSYIEDEGEDEGGLSMRHYIDLGAESDPSESSHQQYYHEDSSDTASVAALLRASSEIQSEPPVIDGTTHYNDYRGADLPGGRREQLLNTLLLGENPNNNEEKRPSLGSGKEDLFGNLAGEGKGKDDRLLTQTNKKESLLRDLLSKPLSEPGAMEPDVTESEAGEEQLAVPDDIDAPGTDGFNNLDLKDWSKDISLGSNTSDVYTEHSIAHDITQNGDNNEFLVKKDGLLSLLAPPSEVSTGGASSNIQSDIDPKENPAGGSLEFLVENHANVNSGSALLAKKDRFLVPLAPPSELSVGGESSVVRSDIGLEDKPAGSTDDVPVNNHADIIIGGSALLAKKDRFLVPLAPPSELSVGGESSVVRSDIGLEDKPAGSTDDVPVNNHADIIIGGSALLAKKDRFLVPLAPPSELSAGGASSDIQSDTGLEDKPVSSSGDMLAGSNASALLAKKDRFLVPLAPPSELSVGGESSVVRSDIGLEDKALGRATHPAPGRSEKIVGVEEQTKSATAMSSPWHDKKHISDDDYLGIRHRSDDDDDDFESSKSSGNDYIQRPSKLQAEGVQKSIRDDLLEPVQQINDVEEDDNIGNERSESASASIGAAPMHEDDDDDSAFESLSSEDTRSGREQVNSAHNEHITEDDRGRYWHQQRDHVLTHSDDNGTEEGYVAGKNKKKNRSEAYLETIEKDENCSDRHGSESSATDSLAPSKDNPPLSARKEKGGSIDQRYEHRYDSNGNSDRKAELSTKAQETERNPRDGDEDYFLSKAQMQSEKDEMVSLTGRSLLSDESEDPNVAFADEEQGLRKRGESHVDVFVSSIYQLDNDDSHFNDGWESDDTSGRSGARPALAQNPIPKTSTFFQWKRAGHWSIFFVVVIIVVAITGTMIPTKSGQTSLIVDPSITSSPPPINPNPNDITPTASPTANENEEDIPDPREWAQVGGALQGEGNDDLAGFAVDVSKDGRSAVMGARRNAEGGLRNRGSVRIFKRVSQEWTQVAELDGEDQGDQFGYSCSISGDGKIVAVGIPGEDSNGKNSGQVRIYEENGGAWNQTGFLNGEEKQDLYGLAVSLDTTGEVLAVGSPYKSANGNEFSGTVYVYRKTDQDENWSSLGLRIEGTSTRQLFGWSVSISSRASSQLRLAIGSPRDEKRVDESGHVTVHQYDANLESWEVIGNKIERGNALDRHGFSVSLSDNGSKLAVGALGDNTNGVFSGAACVYQYEDGNQWNEVGSITGQGGEKLGTAVSLSADGSELQVGRPKRRNSSNESTGQVSVFYVSKTALHPIGDIDGEPGDNIGFSVSSSIDGRYIVAGSPISGLSRVYRHTDALR